MPWPPPTHRVASPLLAPRRCISCTEADEDPAAGGADGMAQGDGAAVDVDLLAIPLKQLTDGQRLDGKKPRWLR